MGHVLTLELFPIVIEKARVAPTRVRTTTRLELSATVMATKASDILNKEIQQEGLQEHFWTDSKFVLGYIINDAKRFRVLIANYIHQIKSLANCKEIVESNWFTEPSSLWQRKLTSEILRHAKRDFRLWCLTEQQQVFELRSCVLSFALPFCQINPQPTYSCPTILGNNLAQLFVRVVNKMPRQKKTNKQLRTTTADDDDGASSDHTSVDGEADSEDTSHQANVVNILAAIHSIRTNFSTQLREVVSSNHEIKEAIGVFSERITSAESHISKAEDDIAALTGKEKFHRVGV